MSIKSWCLTMILVLFGPFAQGNPREGLDNDGKTPEALIESGAVARVLIFHVADSIMTRVALTPKALLSMAGPGYEITTDIKKRLKPVFAGITFQKEHRVSDLRWGLLFYAADSHEIGEVFVDKFGQYGYVDRKAGSFQSEHSRSNLAKELRKLTGDPR